MSDAKKTPFEQAEENIKILANRLDVMNTLSELKTVIDSAKDLPEAEKQGVDKIVEAALKNLSNFLVRQGETWN